MKELKIQIIGLGGVGSWLAEFLTRRFITLDSQLPGEYTLKLILIDYDLVEDKNIQRQAYIQNDIGEYKSFALSRRLQRILPEIDITVHSDRVETTLGLLKYDQTALTFICTDNLSSKILCAKYFTKYIMINCDKGYVELKSFLDDTDLKAWETGSGYTSSQDIDSNILAAITASKYLTQNFNKLHLIMKEGE